MKVLPVKSGPTAPPVQLFRIGPKSDAQTFVGISWEQPLCNLHLGGRRATRYRIYEMKEGGGIGYERQIVRLIKF
jgi:hypothetical protein